MCAAGLEDDPDLDHRVDHDVGGDDPVGAPVLVELARRAEGGEGLRGDRRRSKAGNGFTAPECVAGAPPRRGSGTG